MSALYPRLEKHKTFFLGKKLKFSNIFFSRKISHSAEKCNGVLWNLITYILLINQKTLRGDPFETLKNFRKSRTVLKNNRKGDPLVSSGFVGYIKKVKNERGTLCSKFALAGLGLSSFSSFCKKWTDQCEVCGLKKKMSL